MLRYIDTLRTKPLKERRRIALGVSITFVILITLVWGVVRFASFTGSHTPTQHITPGIIGPYEE